MVACEPDGRAARSPSLARRVLIVGDPPLGRGLLRTMLTRLDYAVAWAGEARECERMMAQHAFRLALVALQLPDAPGLMLARRLVERRERLGGPAIVLFGEAWDDSAVRQECRQAGVDAFLQKPISFTRLVAMLRDLTRAEAPMSPPPRLSGGETDEIDVARLMSFTQGDGQLERELGALFIATAEGHLRDMERSQSTAGWAATAHALKGASANIGAIHLASLAAEAERCAPSAAMVERLHVALARARAFFERNALPADGSVG
jgi:CheY-like chemotaxis protein/HPt (histidine-containing phosphotransfer) domain-containing protein